MNDYYRPSPEQIIVHYQCEYCGAESEVESCFAASRCHHCGGPMIECGQSYPTDADEWDEQRDPDGEWRDRRW